ncbi:MAG: chaperone modulator CbpM [Acidimicrobiia bacterium]
MTSVPSGAEPRHSRSFALRPIGTAGLTVMSIEVLARESDLHPELVQRLIALGALESSTAGTERQVPPGERAARLARIVRLRHDLGVNYAGALLAVDLLARIDVLEDLLAHLRTSTHAGGA